MGKKVISLMLSEQEIDKAIKEIDSYKREFLRKVDIFRERVALRLSREAQSGFNGAIVDDVINGAPRTAQVNVTVNNMNNITLVVASGQDAIWVEFGAGVYHNGSAGSSPHPRGAEAGFTIGGYGKGQGKKQVWGYYEDGELTLTHGTPATMPMERAFLTIINEVSVIAREVFA